MYYSQMAKKNVLILHRLDDLLDTRSWSYAELARQSGVSESLLSKYVNGTQSPSSTTIAKLAQALEVTADYLMGLSDDALPSKEVLPEYALDVLDAMRNMGRTSRYDLMVIAKSFVAAKEEIEAVNIEELITQIMELSDKLSSPDETNRIVGLLTQLQKARRSGGVSLLDSFQE